ncbi:DUF397 domain-containing protein [Nocardia cyriacigeorgica]|uniref:DUF397 domain-containing protein n=1 Tax=Nocardia cyriacigeorgica TaxID=135487 RepID=UPI002454DE21|nr:DUF397 domain-containing protein [Nocardia cyriacigeorgica]
MATTAKYRPHARGWFTSSRSNNGNQCVEVRFDGDAVLIRDSKYRRNPANRPDEEPVITVTAREWTVFIDSLTERGPATSVLTVHTAEDGHIRLGHGATTLVYTPQEWAAFRAGAIVGEFDRIALPA